MESTSASAPELRRWKRAEYERLVDLGVFQAERLELLDGQLVLREPQGARHANAIRRVTMALRAALGGAWQIDSQLPFALDESSEPEPDIAVVPPDLETYRQAHPSRAILLVEIADTSYRIDRQYKLSLYARAGIPEYWIVDLDRERLEVHREPEASPVARHGWHYRSIETLQPPAAVTPLAGSTLPILVADLLP